MKTREDNHCEYKPASVFRFQKKNKKNRSYKVHLELQNLLIELTILNDNS